MAWPFGRHERLRRRASHWLARLNGPHDANDRAAFDKWYEAHPDHAAAFERVARIFDIAGHLEPGRLTHAARLETREATHPRHLGVGLAAAAAVLAVLVVGGVGLRKLGETPQLAATGQVLRNDGGAPRHVRLGDGSEVWLAAESELDVRMGPSERRLQLRRGEGTFAVAHEERPFIVVAGGAEVVARGTKFVVRLGEGATSVALIEGRVEVTYSRATEAEPAREVVVLEPGKTLTVRHKGEIRDVRAGLVREGRSPEMIQLDDSRLGDALVQANGWSDRQLRLADDRLGELRVTGAFRSGDAEEFANALAAALKLRVEHRPDGTLWLSREGGGRH
jgi:transmembrane sensor